MGAKMPVYSRLFSFGCVLSTGVSSAEKSQHEINLLLFLTRLQICPHYDDGFVLMADTLQEVMMHGRDEMTSAPGDRRSRTRFEVFGPFWGTFDAGDAVRVHNLTPYGALIEAKQPLAVESIQSVCLMLDGQPAVADARVRHLKLAPSADGQRYLVGVEFLAAPTAFLEAVDRLMTYRAYPKELA